MDQKTKKELREEKRVVKRLGNKRLRRQARETLETDPEAIRDLEPDYGRYRSAILNGLDRQPNSDEVN